MLRFSEKVTKNITDQLTKEPARVLRIRATVNGTVDFQNIEGLTGAIQIAHSLWGKASMQAIEALDQLPNVKKIDIDTKAYSF